MSRLPLALMFLALLRSAAAVDQPPPQIASPLLVANNPTLTTVALQKPLCLFDSVTSAGAGSDVFKVRLVVADASAPVMNRDSKARYQDTQGGKLGSYLAAIFDVPNCTLVGNSDPTQPDVLGQYLFRVGDNVKCLYDPNFTGECNPPLQNNTGYRFLYALEKNQVPVSYTSWSAPIRTKTVKDTATVDTWPGRRSGGMIVITSILSVLIFFLLTGFVAAVVSNVLGGGSSGIATTRHESQTPQQPMPKPPASTDAAYSSVLAPTMERERYAAKPQA